MSMATVIFYLFAAITAGSGLILAGTRSLIHAGFMLFALLFGVAGMFVFAQAEFLAMMQIVIYVGGILVILLFGIMLTQKMKDMSPKSGIVNLIPGAVIALAMFLALGLMIREMPVVGMTAPKVDDVRAIGIATLTDYLLMFELVSILLLAVLIGAAYLTRKEKTNTGGESA